jgi:hypothetical protein
MRGEDMKRPIVLFLTVSVASVLAFAQEGGSAAGSKAPQKVETLHGYVVDAACAKGISKKQNIMERAAAHTRDCALQDGCAASGFGVFSDSKWYKFDQNGDRLAKALLEKTEHEKGIAVDVTGRPEGGQFLVASMAESTGTGAKSGKTNASPGKTEKIQ